jgi:hypothetical protein
MTADYAPPWDTFEVLKHPTAEARLSGLYCMASCVRWFHRLDDKREPARSVLRRLRAALPGKVVPKTGVIEKHIRLMADVYDLAIYRCGQSPGQDALVTDDNLVSTLLLATVRGLPVPCLRERPLERRYVLVLGLPDKKGRFLVADPTPAVSVTYKVPVEDFRVAWEAGATRTHKPNAVVVWKPDRSLEQC